MVDYWIGRGRVTSPVRFDDITPIDGSVLARVSPAGLGDVVGAGLLSQVPTIMLPERERRELNDGKDTSLVAGWNGCAPRCSSGWTTTPWWCWTRTGPSP
jgi:hypothetical protein